MRRRSTDVAVAVLFVVLSVAMTWPLARNMSRAVSDWGDPYLNACYLDWDVYAATHLGVRLFDAPVFYPNRNTLAFSEHLCGIAIFAAPMRWLGAGPITAANILWILGFAFTGFGTYVLGRMITGCVSAGIVAGIFAAFVPWRFAQLPHLQIAWAGWLPLMIAALLHFSRERTWRNAALFGAMFFMNGWTNLHYFVLGSFAIALATPIALRRDDRAYLKIATTTIVALVMLLPFLLPYRAAMQQYHMRGDVAETRSHSAVPGDWLYVTELNRFYAPLQTNDGPVDPERRLFPGYLALLLAMAGIWFGRGTPRAIGLVWIVVGFLGSLGLNGWFHSALFNSLGVFRGIRVPARWAVIAYFGIAMLAALGVAVLTRRTPSPPAPLPRRRERVAEGRVRVALIAIALLFELRAAPIHWFLAPRDTPAVYTWLRTAQMRGAIAHLPFGIERDEFEYMLFETAHHRPMLNGWGFNPPSTTAILALARQNPIPDALMDRLEASRCSLVILHNDRAIAEKEFVLRQVALGRLIFLRRFDNSILGDDVYAVRRNEPDAKPGVRVERNSIPFGYLATVRPEVTGWASAPEGVARVTLWIDNHSVAIPASLAPAPWVERRFRMPAVTFRGTVSKETDLEVEIIGRDGKSTLLPGVSVSGRSR